MNAEHFLAWLHVAALEHMATQDLREVLEQVLDQAPQDGGEPLESLLDAIEDQLDAEEIDHKVLLAWPSRFSSLLPPPRVAPRADVKDDLASGAQLLPADEVESPRLDRFKSCLEALRSDSDQARTEAELEGLETEIAQALTEYAAEPFSGEAMSAESAAGHRHLQDGFACWFEAFHLVKAGRLEEALIAASEGNRLFRAVAQWSDQVSA